MVGIHVNDVTSYLGLVQFTNAEDESTGFFHIDFYTLHFPSYLVRGVMANVEDKSIGFFHIDFYTLHHLSYLVIGVIRFNLQLQGLY